MKTDLQGTVVVCESPVTDFCEVVIRFNVII
jgi:hypothetical protein